MTQVATQLICVCTVMGTSIAIDGGSVEFTGLTPGSEAVYTCDDGYEIEGESTRTCKMATWSGEAPQCVELSKYYAVLDCSTSYLKCVERVGKAIYVCSTKLMLTPLLDSS